MVGLQTLDLAIGVRVPASQPKMLSDRGSRDGFGADENNCKDFCHDTVVGSSYSFDDSVIQCLRTISKSLIPTTVFRLRPVERLKTCRSSGARHCID